VSNKVLSKEMAVLICY